MSLVKNIFLPVFPLILRVSSIIARRPYQNELCILMPFVYHLTSVRKLKIQPFYYSWINTIYFKAKLAFQRRSKAISGIIYRRSTSFAALPSLISLSHDVSRKPPFLEWVFNWVFNWVFKKCTKKGSKRGGICSKMITKVPKNSVKTPPFGRKYNKWNQSK